MATSFVAATIPAKSIWVSNTTLWHVAQQYLGNALHAPEIARLNGLSDPWIIPLTQILIPPVASTAPLTSIFGA